MSIRSDALPNAIDDGGKWFWNFLKKELTPYPGRAWVVARVTISASIVMLLVMTFRLPGGFLGAIFTFFISRENPTATFLSGLKTILAFVIASAYAAIGIVILLDDPLTHFLWVAVSLFLSFYLIRIFADYGTAVAFGFMVAGAIPLWDETSLNVNDRFENMLWLAYVVAIGVVVSIVVEYIFRRVHPATDLTEGIEVRLLTVENLLRSASEESPLASEWEKKLSLYTTVGSSRLRRLILRSEYGPHFKAQMSAAVSLVGRLIDIAATFRVALSEQIGPIDASDRERCRRLANQIKLLSDDLLARRLPEEINLPASEAPPKLPFLATMEATVALIPKSFAGSESMQESVPAPLDEERAAPLFVVDAFTNPAHLQFALRGTLAAMACYVVYTAIAWPGLSTSVATCFITALSTIGSSRQKQMLRLGGALLGGFVFGMGAQIFVLPYLDTIFGFTILFGVVTAISAWLATASARLSYLGVQLALAFYLINMQEFTVQTSLAIARDRVFGVLLGLVSMWLLFDRLWMRKAVDEMQAVFVRNLEMFAQLAEELLKDDHIEAIKRIRQLRDQINAGFQSVTAQSDAVLFEFGAERRRKIELREDVRRWQPTIRTLLQLQITSSQYRLQRPLKDLPPTIAQAHIAFEKDVAVVMRSLANEVSGKPAMPVPDIRASAAKMRQEFEAHFAARGVPMSPESADMIGLSESLAGVLEPLYQDIHSRFAARDLAIEGGTLVLHGEPGS